MSWAKQKKQYAVIGAFLGLMGLLLAVIFHFAVEMGQQAGDSVEAFSSLEEAYRKDGIGGFLKSKAALKRKLKSDLAGGSTSEEHLNIAVYLFPDVLDAEDFEREEGQENWAPQQAQIEKAPRTPASRVAFEEMRANIWNYENPDKTSPQLSPQARQVIRIYEALSAP